MEVHGAHHGVVEDLGGRHLDAGDLAARRVSPLGVDAPGGVEDLQPELGQLDPGVGDLVLGQLFAGQQFALGGAAEGALTEHVEAAGHRAHGAHGVVEAPPAEPGLGDGEGLALATQQVLCRHPHRVVAHVGVVARPLAVIAHAGAPDDLEALGAGRDQEHRRALVDRDVGVAHRHDDDEGGPLETRREPLLALDHPLVAVAPGRGGEERGVGPALGLGHRVARRDATFEKGLEEPFLLRRRPVVGQDLGVARIGRLAPEDARGEGGAAQDLVHVGQADLPITLAPELGGQVGRPQALGPYPFLEGPDEGVVDGVGLVVNDLLAAEGQVEWFDLFGHEGPDPFELRGERRIDVEAGHWSPLVVGPRAGPRVIV